MVEHGSKTCRIRQIYPHGGYLLAGAITANWVEASYSITLYCAEEKQHTWHKVQIFTFAVPRHHIACLKVLLASKVK
jgi:hypothetical protein